MPNGAITLDVRNKVDNIDLWIVMFTDMTDAPGRPADTLDGENTLVSASKLYSFSIHILLKEG